MIYLKYEWIDTVYQSFYFIFNILVTLLWQKWCYYIRIKEIFFMRKYNILLTMLVAGLLTGCTSPKTPSEKSSETKSETPSQSESVPSASEPEEKLDVHEIKVDHYNISYCPYLNEDPRELTFEGKWSEYKSSKQFDFVYLNNEDELPYLTVETYASLLSGDVKEGTTLETKEEGQASTFIAKKGDKTLLSINFDCLNKKVTKKPGAVESEMKPIHSLKNSVNDYIQSQEEIFIGADLDFVYTWENTGFKTFTYKGHNYFPLSLLDLQISRETGRSFWYLGGLKSIYEVADTKQYLNVSLTITNKEGTEVYRTVEGFANDLYKEKFGKDDTDGGQQVRRVFLPLYLASYSRDAFYYAMDNFYGLGQTIGYKSMAAFLNNTKYAEEMLSPDGRIRARAYSYAVSILNDGHTGFTGSSVVDEGTAMGFSYVQTLLNDRSSLQRILKQRRDDQLEKEGKDVHDVRYSTDGKVAYFSFDEFGAVNYDPSEGKPSDINTNDTYLFFLNCLNTIKSKGGVEKVVIDDTMNGGGYVGQLCKLLCLLSKDNSSIVYFRCGENGAIGRMVSKADVNLDGKIDANDVTFGNDFKFYILTSSFSFSCGNAFPCYARDNNLATIIGSKTGGGECVVGGSQLPYNSYLTYSSNFHLGYYNANEKTFNGYEEGALGTAFSGNYYDVDEVAKALK